MLKTTKTNKQLPADLPVGQNPNLFGLIRHPALFAFLDTNATDLMSAQGDQLISVRDRKAGYPEKKSWGLVDSSRKPTLVPGLKGRQGIQCDPGNQDGLLGPEGVYLPDDWTLSLVLQPTYIAATSAIFTTHPEGLATGIALTSANALRAYINGNVSVLGDFVTAGLQPAVGSTQVYTVSYHSADGSLAGYVNGVKIGDTLTGLPVNSGNQRFRISGRDTESSDFSGIFEGIFHHAVVFNAAAHVDGTIMPTLLEAMAAEFPNPDGLDITL